VWFAGSKYGLTWKAKQIAVHKLPERIGDFAFKGLASAPSASEDDTQIDDDEVFKKPSVLAAVMPSKASTASVSAAGTIGSSAADEEEVDDEDADDVEPVPAPKKTIIKKKVIVTGAKK
jgi:hypothetical protein